MNRYLITSVAALFLLLALVALVEIIWDQEPEQPAIETPAATTTPTPTPTGPLTIQITGLEGAKSIDDVWTVIEIQHCGGSKMDVIKILDEHLLWLNGEGGSRADLSGANLFGADLCCGSMEQMIWNIHTAFYPLQ